jgi:hypothetical protein
MNGAVLATLCTFSTGRLDVIGVSEWPLTTPISPSGFACSQNRFAVL